MPVGFVSQAQRKGSLLRDCSQAELRKNQGAPTSAEINTEDEVPNASQYMAVHALLSLGLGRGATASHSHSSCASRAVPFRSTATTCNA